MKRILTLGLTAMCAAAVSLTAVSAPDASAVPNRTPGLNEVFNGFVVGTLRDGTLASPDQIIKPMQPGDPFYREPALKPSDVPGTLLKAKKVDVQYTGFRPANVDAWKAMFVTSDLQGNRDISTGIIMIPRDGKKNSERKVVGFQMANDSVGGNCHPSAMWTGADPMDGSSMSALGPLAQMFGKGYAVVISDVGNNGDMSPHGVFAGKYNAMSTLDGLRAAFALGDAGLSKDAPIGLFGIAGGGVGIAFAAEKAQQYAPELNIRATVLEGMVVNYRNFIRTSDGSIGSGFAMATLLGLEPAYPDMKVDEKLSPLGKQVADYYRTQCQTPAYFTLPMVPLSALFNGKNPADIKDFQRAYNDNLIGKGTPSPSNRVLIASCAKDDSPMSLVPAADSRNLAKQWRSRGAHVDYQPTDCSMVNAITNIYGWGTDLFGMQTIDWLAASLKK